MRTPNGDATTSDVAMSLTPAMLRGESRSTRRRQYIDVLDIVDIVEAVEKAKEQLRRGLQHAMSSNLCDENGDVIQPRSATRSRPKPKGPTDSHGFYSALLGGERPTKAAATSAGAGAGASTSAAAATEPRARPNTKSWNSKLQAGPSLLSKRPRSEPVAPPEPKRPASAATLSRSSSVASQPAVNAAAAAPPPLRSAARPAAAAAALRSAARPTTTTTAALPRAGAVATSAATTNRPQSTTGSANASRLSALRAKESRSRAIDTGNYAHIRKAAPRASGGGASSSSTPAAASAPRRVNPRPTPRGLTLLKPAAPRAPISAESVVARRSVGDDLFAAVRNANSSGGLLPTTLVRAAARRPPPTTSNVATVSGVLIPPLMKAIGTVPPNGYMKTGDGLKPVVTKDPKVNPKVPLKLRQNFAEKLFAAFQNNAHAPLEPMDALIKTLRMEQTMYAQAAGKIDYRAAALTNLTEAKKKSP